MLPQLCEYIHIFNIFLKYIPKSLYTVQNFFHGNETPQKLPAALEPVSNCDKEVALPVQHPCEGYKHRDHFISSYQPCQQRGDP